MKILAIDPGKRSIAWAWFNPDLRECGFQKHRRDPFERGLRAMLESVAKELPAKPNIVVVELPRIYPFDRGKRPNDIVDLAAVAGACVVFGEVFFVTPQQWKGQTPKGISASRTMRVLTRLELAVMKRWNNNEHVLDAVGVGLWYREQHGRQ